jgi:DNA-binding PadR family transcriptional regulator
MHGHEHGHKHGKFQEFSEDDPRSRGGGRGRGARFGDPFTATNRGRGGGRGRGRGRPDFFGFGRHGGFGPGFGGRGPRVGRGDVRAAILALLAEEPMHGYQIITELTERSGGVWRPSPGSVYPTLQAMEDQGLVTADTSEGRRVFSLTPQGQEAAAVVTEGPAPWEDAARGADRSLIDLKGLAIEVGAAIMQVGRAGSDDQVKAVADILTDTRRRIYLVLAEGSESTGSANAGSQEPTTTAGPDES